MKQTPISAFEETRGMTYFPRMLDKIRKHANGELREDFHGHLSKRLDMRICRYLRVSYNDVCARVADGFSDDEVLTWCFENGRALDDHDIYIWNEFSRKIGWSDGASEMLVQRKVDSNLAERDDIQTMYDYFEYDEDRKT
ncbi:MAG: DUF5069 domain-containing protein [Verrucomicrobiota bacterium]